MQAALQKTLDIICGKWRLQIIYLLGTGNQRYSQLRRLLPEVSEKVLVQELKTLIRLGVIEKKPFGDVAARTVYKLTQKGWEVLPTLQTLPSVGAAFLEL